MNPGRDLDTLCPRCGGQGKRYYPNTATWRGGMGGSEMTLDLCDQCWGSGDRTQPWTDVRKLERLALEEGRASNALMQAQAEILSFKQAEVREAAVLEAARALVRRLGTLSADPHLRTLVRPLEEAVAALDAPGGGEAGQLGKRDSGGG